MEYPKVLMINEQSIEKNNATGITMRSLWAEWPSKSIFEIHIEPQKYENKKLGITSITPAINPLRKLSRNKALSKANENMKDKVTTKNKKRSRKSAIKTKIRQLLVCLVDAYPVKLSKDQMKVIDNFIPQVIYTLGASVNTLQLVNTLAEKYNIPVVIHYMDNWPEHIQWEDNSLLIWYKNLLQKWNRITLKHARELIVISPSMKAAYELAFGKECCVLMNAVNINELYCEHRSIPDSTIHFVYAGGLHLNRWKALKDISEVIKENGVNGVLDIYTSDIGQKLESVFKGLPVTFHSEVSHDDIIQVYINADVLVHAEVKNNTLLGYFVYSISTKIPEYLATGKPVLFYGPKDMGLYVYLEENNAAFVASTRDELIERIHKINDDKEVEKKGYNARKLVLQNHSIEHSRSTLFTVLSNVVKN